MVKVTIEYEGKTVILEGDCVIGMVLNRAAKTYAVQAQLIGQLAPSLLPRILAEHAVNIIGQSEKDPKAAAERMLEFSAQADMNVEDWIRKNNVDAMPILIDKIKESLDELSRYQPKTGGAR